MRWQGADTTAGTVAGTEVSKESADMVLADDNFASIVNAVEEGRHAWKNFQKAVLHTLPTNGGHALLIMGAVLLAPLVALFSIRLPLEPIHILWVNLADSVFLTLPLMMEPKERGLLDGPPRNPNERIANRLFLQRVGLVSILMAATGFATYHHFGAPALAAVADDCQPQRGEMDRAAKNAARQGRNQRSEGRSRGGGRGPVSRQSPSPIRASRSSALRESSTAGQISGDCTALQETQRWAGS